jgi:hypothetical protein
LILISLGAAEYDHGMSGGYVEFLVVIKAFLVLV